MVAFSILVVLNNLLGFDEILNLICDLFLNDKKDNYTQFINISKPDVVKFLKNEQVEIQNVKVDEDLYDEQKTKRKGIPDGMYQ
jgi:hypothetical protein